MRARYLLMIFFSQTRRRAAHHYIKKKKGKEPLQHPPTHTPLSQQIKKHLCHKSTSLLMIFIGDIRDYYLWIRTLIIMLTFNLTRQ